MKYEEYRKQGYITVYYIGGKEMVMLNSSRQSMSMEEFDKMEQDRIKKDRMAGYTDRKVHYYDKWYRYNRWDEGRAYDEGCKQFLDEPHTDKWFDEDENFRIIENVQ